MFADTATGLENVTCCQPDADSDVNVACANNTPDELHKLPTCVPVFNDPLKNRTPVTNPLTSDRNFTPNSTALVSPEIVGGVTDDDHTEHGHTTELAVVNDHEVGPDMGLPAVSVAPDTVAV